MPVPNLPCGAIHRVQLGFRLAHLAFDLGKIGSELVAAARAVQCAGGLARAVKVVFSVSGWLAQIVGETKSDRGFHVAY